MELLKNILLLSLFLFSIQGFPCIGQEITTADEYFEKVSQIYGDITDYEATIIIMQGETIMQGVIYYKNPNLIKINFTEPAEQYLLVNSETLTIYIPEHSVILKQELPRRSEASLAAIANSQGLIYLRDNYKVAYVVGPEPVPLNEEEVSDILSEDILSEDILSKDNLSEEKLSGDQVSKDESSDDSSSSEKVVKLKFQWRASAEGFKDIEIAFNTENGLIRRVIGITATNVNVQFDFLDVKINQGLPEELFVIEDPPSAYEYNNFLFGDE